MRSCTAVFGIHFIQRLMDESQHGVRVPFGPIDIVNRELLKRVSVKISKKCKIKQQMNRWQNFFLIFFVFSSVDYQKKL